MKKLLLLHLLLAMFLGAQTAGASVVLNEANFPDANFRTYISTLTGVGDGGTISDDALARVKEITVGSKGIYDLTGIEYFTELTRLKCYSNQLTWMDITKNTELTSLDCSNNQLIWIDVTKNTKLTYLYCGKNQLTSLDVTKNTELTTLSCYSNQLTKFDVTNNTELTLLTCHSNQLTSLDVTKNTKLFKLFCHNNQLSSLDVSKNTKLVELDCRWNNISYLYLSKNTELEVLSCSSNKIDQLNLSNNTKLTTLLCTGNRLTNLKLDNNTSLASDKVNVDSQESTRRFQINNYNSNVHNCWTLFVNTTDAARIRSLRIDGVSKTPNLVHGDWLIVSDDLKKIPQKVEYEIYTGNEVAGWMPVTVNYDVKHYHVYVAGEELTSLNFYDIPGLKEGTAYFYDESYDLGWSGIYPTLVLYDAKIEGEEGIRNEECYNLNIIVRGNNEVIATDYNAFSNNSAAVWTYFSGGGTLHLTATGDRWHGIYALDSYITIKDATKITAQGDGYGYFDDNSILYIQDNSILACYGNKYPSVELPVESKCKFDSNIGIRYPAGAYIGDSYHVFYAGTTTDVQQDWVVIGPDNQATQDLITGLTTNAQQHEYVDLGLPSGTLWATCNVGANSPEEYGDYFAWGETEPKSDYTWGTYFDTDDGGNSFKKYNYNNDGGLTELLPEDDAATANWGSEWQMPSDDQIDELYNSSYTTTEWTQVNGVNGRKITSKSNGKSIFLPAAGYRKGTSLINAGGDGGDGGYWSRALNTSDSYYACYLNFYSDGIGRSYSGRNYGQSVRPVRVPVHPVTNIELSETSIYLKVDETRTISATVLPDDADNKSVIWSSSNTDVATVDQNGMVTAKAAGTCTITCAATDGSGVKAECQVKVMPEPEYVDLGLPSSTLWATTNIGATSPEDYGDFFAWGETKPKSDYTWETYFDIDDGGSTFKKYNKDGGLTELLPEDDAATANWGSEWQMPSDDQIDELYNNSYTTAEWTTQNGVNGYKITSKSNGKSIFLPAAGFRAGTSLYYAGSYGGCWSRSLYASDSYYACYLDFYSGYIYGGYDYRSCGQSVRPVRTIDIEKQVYTEFVEETGTLTYYYDDQMASRPGVTEVYDPVGNPDAVRFTGYYKKVTKAVIDPSMKDANLTSMRSMFCGGYNSETSALQFLINMTSIEGLENLNTAIVTDMNSMFSGCESLTSLDLSSFNTSNVTNMNGMFLSCTGLQIVDVSSFDISNVTDMRMMFGSCRELTTICCDKDWSNTSADSYVMFSGCKKLVGGKGTPFDSNVINATYAHPDGGTYNPGYFTADTMTGIQSIHNSQFTIHNAEAIYNLAGQKMVNDKWSNTKLPRGIYIKDGKKVIRK